ncbi:hypothetical protein D3C86_1714480 [compost metagenome]
MRMPSATLARMRWAALKEVWPALVSWMCAPVCACRCVAVVAAMPAGLASARCGVASSGKRPSVDGLPWPRRSSFCCLMAWATVDWSSLPSWASAVRAASAKPSIWSRALVRH